MAFPHKGLERIPLPLFSGVEWELLYEPYIREKQLSPIVSNGPGGAESAVLEAWDRLTLALGLGREGLRQGR
jgi:hypothetical protein